MTLALAAALAIPAAVNAQSTTSAKQEKTECSKNGGECKKGDKKECCKDDKACTCKDTKAMKGKKGKHGMKAKSGKMGSGERMGKRQADRKDGMRRGENPMLKGITLSADQQKQLDDLRAKRSASAKDAKAKAKADAKEMKTRNREEMKKMREEFDKELEKILTPDQLKQYQANKAEMESRRAERSAQKGEKK